jgi:cytochrome c-type biogenesis protein CcmH/NrfF
MESLLWAMNLCAVVFLCLWALKTDKRRDKEMREMQEAQERAAAARREGRNA